MPTLKRGRPSAATSAKSSNPNKRLSEINDAFDSAVGFQQPPSTETTTTTAGKSRSKGKGKARAVVFDDEEEQTNQDGDVDMNNLNQPSNQAGGFMSEERLAGGGFMVEPNQGGGFMMDDSTLAQSNFQGGFINESIGGGQPGSSEGGFFVDPDSNSVGGMGGGGFFAENQIENDNGLGQNDQPFAAGGGFFIDDSNETPSYSNLPQGGGGFMPIDSTNEGGFFPSLPFSSSNDLDSFTLPTPPRPSRIPLSRIPQTLRSLGIPRGNDRQIMEMFEEVGSTDEEDNGNGEKLKSVRRERFIEAMEVLLVDRDDEGSESDKESNEGEEEGDEYEEENPTNPTRRRSTRVTRQSARTNPNKQPVQDEQEGGQVDEVDFADRAQGEEEQDDVSSASASEGEPTSEEEEEEEEATKGSAKTRKATTSKSKSKRKRHDPLQPVSKKDLEAASDTFDLFFEDSPQLALGQESRTIGLAELKKVTRVLKEKFTDEDLLEMLEFAGTGNVVNKENFARILLET